MKLTDEIQRRRTVAIISHPDAGKTTLTEKFLLYGGAVQEAGSVRARKTQRSATSDWMEMERKRGISITSTLLQFEYNNYRVNLLDTPGHQDFSEDTYRILTAVDAVIMVIDGAKGIELQTKKLFQVCKKRSIPIFTFINKLDRPAQEPLDLLDEIERILEINVYPMNWPLGNGIDFKGVYDRGEKSVHLFERTTGGAFKAAESLHDLSDPILAERLDQATHEQVMEELEMLEVAGEEFDLDAVSSGDLTPVFFGSAMNNFGVQLLLDNFLKFAPSPGPMMSVDGLIKPEHEAFSGFIFKIQANMDPRHRDRIAFCRVCSGQFSRNIVVNNTSTGKKTRLNSSHVLFGKQRESVETAYAGDVIGFVGNAKFSIGDTLTEDANIKYQQIPFFAPEHFVFLTNPNPSNYKRFHDGLNQLLEEGVVQSFNILHPPRNMPLLGAVGPLQFEVVQYRLKSEYNAESHLEPSSWKLLRWIDPETPAEKLTPGILPLGSALAEDRRERKVILFTSQWFLQTFQEKNPEIDLLDTPFDAKTER